MPFRKIVRYATKSPSASYSPISEIYSPDSSPASRVAVYLQVVLSSFVYS